ncbi:sensor histidine kinase [Streptomyces sp. NPDC002888]|uniref:sensor histidine kinase n=1 Tax=Streptomyces sp. NPDC002888 TaxID=3364668 RepID=UPI0036B8290F
MGGPGRWWRSKSTPAKVEWYTRWTFHFFAVMEVAALGLQLFGQVEPRLAGMLLLMMCLHATACAMTASVALDWTRGLREQPVRMVWTLGVITAVIAVAAVTVAEHGPDADGVDGAAGGVYGVVLLFGTGVMSLGVRSRRRVFAIVAGFAAGLGLVSFALGMTALTVFATSLMVLLGGGLLAFTSIFSVWLLNAVFELDEARETRARLAVAEERLRFGRDLHDVMGRNLAVIALKSELSVQLARRGRPEAVEQMIEVQRIAQESQREVRDVVRGYRDADLGVELAGAQGVLTAAGISCEVTGEAVGLPGEVQSALAWVVREATTNVLRHGDAGRCSVGLQVTEGHVVLTVENDGVAGVAGVAGVTGVAGVAASPGGGGGSGLAGLRERLAAVDGTLVAGPTDTGVFRLVAEVPLASAEVAS